MQNEYYFKAILRKKMDEFLNEALCGDHDMGWIPEGIENAMTDAAWIILSQNVSTQSWLIKEGYLE